MSSFTSFSLSNANATENRSKITNVRDVRQETLAAEFVVEKQEKEAMIKEAMNALKNKTDSLENSASAKRVTNSSGFDNRLYRGSSATSFPNMHNNLTPKTICLNMIVKNEAHVIAETLENLWSYVKFDYYVVCDTGSTDATKEIVAAFFKERGVPGEIYDHEWRDFGYNRSLALDAAYNKADYSFIFDADDKIVGDFELVQPLRSDSYHFKFGNGFNYLRILMVNSRQRWQFRGVLHEFITCTEQTGQSETIQGKYYVESGRRGARNKVANKYLNDAHVLERGFHEEMKPGGDRSMAERYAFYCAQSYKDGGAEHIKDAIQWYERVLTLNNWAQEKYYSCLMLGELYDSHPDKSRETLMKSQKYLLMASHYDPARIEGVATVMEQYRHEGLNTLVNLMYHKYKGYSRNQVDKLFVNQGKYEYCIEYNNSISAFYVGDAVSGYECCKEILTTTRVPIGYYTSTIDNVMFYKDQLMKDRYTSRMMINLEHYISETARAGMSVSKGAYNLWNALFALNRAQLARYTSYNFKNRRTKNVKVMLTFTTCKRYDLFQQTINSIINQWADVENVDYWFCVDDNSSVEDRNRMRKNYRWIRYYMKRPEQKGHRESMNIIYAMLQRIRPKYWIHMEDDFLFHTRMDYVTPAIKYLEALKESHGVRQVLFNRGYGETIEDYKIESYTEFDVQTTERIRDIDGGRGIKIGAVLQDYRDEPGTSYPYSNCHYWPHYSFRPALIDVDAVFQVGDFNTENQFFEMDYARKWVECGFKSAFFNRITNRHIGRLTSERHDKKLLNAYELNSESQFQKVDKDNAVAVSAATAAAAAQNVYVDPKQELLENTLELELELEDDENNICEETPQEKGRRLVIQEVQDEESEQELDIPIKIVNLKRRPDRREESISKLAAAGISQEEYTFVDAVDGAQIIPTPQLKRLFQGNDFGSRRGVIGCALSHYHLWKQLLADSTQEFYLIMEDDFELCPHFKRAINAMYDEFVNRDVIFMGYHMFEEKRARVKHIYNRDLNLNVDAAAVSTTDSDSDSSHVAQYNGLDLAVEPLNKNLYIGATHCYSVNKRGAKLLVEYIEVHGIKHGIDYLMKIANNGLECYETQPHLALADWNEAGKQIDTDIQFDFNSVNFDLVDDEYTFFPGLDAPEGDIKYIGNGNAGAFNLDAWIKEANATDGCVAFNTYGFLKRAALLSQLCETPYINAGNRTQHGIYIKTDYAKQQKQAQEQASLSLSINVDDVDVTDTVTTTPPTTEPETQTPTTQLKPQLRIKMICNWCSSQQLCTEWSNMCERNFRWKNIEMTWSNNPDEIDYYVIINYPMNANEHYVPERTLVYQMEPTVFDASKRWGTKTWGEWANPDPAKFMHVNAHSKFLNCVQWIFRYPLKQLRDSSTNFRPEHKLDRISCILSSKKSDEGHILRNALISYIESESPSFSNASTNDLQSFFNVFGQSNYFNYRSYIGKLPEDNPLYGIKPYKYYFMCENNAEHNYATEKIWEPILCETLCFYWGCPNLDDYIDSRAYVRLDVADKEGSLRIMEDAIKNDLWSERIPYIRAAKEKILNELAFFPRLQSIIETHEMMNEE